MARCAESAFFVNPKKKNDADGINRMTLASCHALLDAMTPALFLN